MSLARAEADLASARNDVRRYETLLEAARQRLIKLEHYIEMARLYAEMADTDGEEDPSTGSRRPRGGVSGDAVRTAISLLRERRQPILTRELVELLRERGIALSGALDRQITNLSGYLSRTPELVSNRVRGWHLREWEGEDLLQSETGSEERRTLTKSEAVRAGAANERKEGELEEAAPFKSTHSPPSPFQAALDAPIPRALIRGGSVVGGSDVLKGDLDDDIPF